MEWRGYFEPKDFHIALKGVCKTSLEEGQNQQGRKEVCVSLRHPLSLPKKVNPKPDVAEP